MDKVCAGWPTQANPTAEDPAGNRLTHPCVAPLPQAMLLACNKDGVSIHSHLTELIHSLLTDKDANALLNLENISLGVKAKRFAATEPGERVRPLCPDHCRAAP